MQPKSWDCNSTEIISKMKGAHDTASEAMRAMGYDLKEFTRRWFISKTYVDGGVAERVDLKNNVVHVCHYDTLTEKFVTDQYLIQE